MHDGELEEVGREEGRVEERVREAGIIVIE